MVTGPARAHPWTVHDLLAAVVEGFLVCPLAVTPPAVPPPLAIHPLHTPDDLVRDWAGIRERIRSAAVRVVVVHQRPTDAWIHDGGPSSEGGVLLVPPGLPGRLEFWGVRLAQQALRPPSTDAVGPLVVVNGRVTPGPARGGGASAPPAWEDWLRGLLGRVTDELVLWTTMPGLRLEDVVQALADAPLGARHPRPPLRHVALRLDRFRSTAYPQFWMDRLQERLPPDLHLWLHVPPFSDEDHLFTGYPATTMTPETASRITATVVWPEAENETIDWLRRSPQWSFVGTLGALGGHIVLLCRGTSSHPPVALFETVLASYTFRRLTVCHRPAPDDGRPSAPGTDRTHVADLGRAKLAGAGAGPFVWPGRRR